MMVVMYSVQRQPRYDMSMKPPINGASRGLQKASVRVVRVLCPISATDPLNTVTENTVMARPLCRLLLMLC
jgi:hypothetical protein